MGHKFESCIVHQFFHALFSRKSPETTDNTAVSGLFLCNFAFTEIYKIESFYKVLKAFCCQSCCQLLSGVLIKDSKRPTNYGGGDYLILWRGFIIAVETRITVSIGATYHLEK